MRLIAVLTVLTVSLFALAACGGDDESDPTATQVAAEQPSPTATTAEPTPTELAPEPTPTEPPPEPTPTEPVPEPSPTEADEASGGEDEVLIEQGRVIFEETAGGIGCAACHGMDAKGDPNIGSADIRGAGADRIRGALASVEMMAIVELTDEEIEAVAAYLATFE